MFIFEDLIRESSEDRTEILSMLAAPLVHIAECEGVDFEESEYIRPFCESLQISVDLLGCQITDDEYRVRRIRDLGIWLGKKTIQDKDAVLLALKMICLDVATASADRSGNHVSPDEHTAMKEIQDLLNW